MGLTSGIALTFLIVLLDASSVMTVSYANDSDVTMTPLDELLGNETEVEEPAHGVHLAGINFEYVRQPLTIAIFLLIVALCKLGFHHANFLSSKVPESCLLIVLGTVVSAIIHYTGNRDEHIIKFSAELFFLYLLPPIILEAAYSLHDRVFFDNLGTILLYAVVGTILNCFIIAPSLYGLALCGAMGPITITLVQCFVFGALIVAVDPVAVLAIFQEIGVNNVLYFLVFGESLLNDAVTVVIYNTMKAFIHMETIPVNQIFLAFGAFFTVSIGGLCIGLLIGGLSAFITKYTRSVQVVEPLAIFALAYSSYLMAELFHFSGIISIIGCGLVQAQYAFHNISHKSHTTVVYFSKVLSTTSDSIIFMFLGFSLIGEKLVWHSGFILWSILLCFVVRFIIVYFLTFFANKCMRLRIVNYEEQFIMAYGGLRGAVAFSLVAMLKETNLPHQDLFETATLAVIIFTVFVQGISIKPLVKCLRVSAEAKNPVSIYEEINNHVTDHVLAGIEEICGHYGANRVRAMVDVFDNHYLRPFLMRNPKTKDDGIMELYEKMALQMHFESIAGATMWTEYTSDYELYKPEIIVHDEASSGSDIAFVRLERQGRHSLYSSTSASYNKQRITTRQRSASDAVYLKPSDRQRREANLANSYGNVNKDQEEQADSGRARSSSLLDRLKKTFSSNEEEERPANEEPTIEDLRRWLVKNPATQVFLYKTDKNLTNEGSIDFLHHLHEKQIRTRRLSKVLKSPSRSAAQSPIGSPFGSSENIAGTRRKPVLNVITEGVPLEKDNVKEVPGGSSSEQQPATVLRPRRLTQLMALDADGLRHTFPKRYKHSRRGSQTPNQPSQSEASDQPSQSEASTQEQEASDEKTKRHNSELRPSSDLSQRRSADSNDQVEVKDGENSVTREEGITDQVDPISVEVIPDTKIHLSSDLPQNKAGSSDFDTKSESDIPDKHGETFV